MVNGIIHQAVGVNGVDIFGLNLSEDFPELLDIFPDVS
jgi:hypothetical protein